MAKKRSGDFLDPKVLSKLSRLDIRARGLVEGSFSGQHKSPHKGSSVEFSQYRKYVAGDDIKNLDWKVYARSDRFYIKEFEADTNLRCYLVVDCSGSMGFSGESGSKMDYARKLAGSLAYLLVLQSDSVGLHCFNDTVISDIPPRNKPSHLHNIFEVLSSVPPRGETDIVTILHNLAEKIRKRALVIVFSDFFAEVEPLIDCFHHLMHRKHDLAVFHLVDDAEMNFNFNRPIRFIDMEDASTLISEPGMTRNEYLRIFTQYMENIKKGCREFKVDYRLCRMSEPYDSVLSDFLLERMRK